jgi:hypothetical protein
MSHELFYTSAPKGLQPGSRGFCTVASTRNLPAAVAEKLESLSAYRAVFPPHDPRASQNPVVYSHLQLNIAGKVHYVLSRVSAAALDYTQRSNKFAHHVVLTGGELPPGGPAWLLSQPGFMETTWEGPVRWLDAGRVPPHGEASPPPCREWQKRTGDAGWAGVVAESFGNGGRLAYLIIEPGLDPLPLIAEALALLPPRRRWDVTFTTYFAGLPLDVNCVWRCVLKGSPEEKNSRRLPGSLIIDLTSDLGKAGDQPLAVYARTGRRPTAAATSQAAADSHDGPVPLAAPANRNRVAMAAPLVERPFEPEVIRLWPGWATWLPLGLVVGGAVGVSFGYLVRREHVVESGPPPVTSVAPAPEAAIVKPTKQDKVPEGGIGDKAKLERVQADVEAKKLELAKKEGQIDSLKKPLADLSGRLEKVPAVKAGPKGPDEAAKRPQPPPPPAEIAAAPEKCKQISLPERYRSPSSSWEKGKNEWEVSCANGDELSLLNCPDAIDLGKTDGKLVLKRKDKGTKIATISIEPPSLHFAWEDDQAMIKEFRPKLQDAILTIGPPGEPRKAVAFRQAYEPTTELDLKIPNRGDSAFSRPGTTIEVEWVSIPLLEQFNSDVKYRAGIRLDREPIELPYPASQSAKQNKPYSLCSYQLTQGKIELVSQPDPGQQKCKLRVRLKFKATGEKLQEEDILDKLSRMKMKVLSVYTVTDNRWRVNLLEIGPPVSTK